MKNRQKKKDLFTVDTVGEQNDSENEFGDSEILYPVEGAENTGDSENSDAEDEEVGDGTEEKENASESMELDEDNRKSDEEEEDEYDYGGKKNSK